MESVAVDAIELMSLRCDVVYALSQVVKVRSVYWQPTCCDECERRPWCQTAIEYRQGLGEIREGYAAHFRRQARRGPPLAAALDT